MPKVVAITTSLGTRWESYSQVLLQYAAPSWLRLVHSGRENWSPTGFIDRVLRVESDYVCHIDEDCFVKPFGSLGSVIDVMESDQSLAAAGIPDGGHYYRENNPAALNLFFVLFKTSALRKAWSERDSWNKVKFQDIFGDEVLRQRPDLDLSRVNWNEAEPYYPLFWSLLQQGKRFLYLREILNEARWSTFVAMPSGEILAEHLWYLRNWRSNKTMPGHDLPNMERYQSLKQELDENCNHLAGFKGRLLLSHAKRCFRNLLF